VATAKIPNCGRLGKFPYKFTAIRSYLVNYDDLDVSRIVNAQGNTTPLGSCTLSEGVIDAMAYAARRSVDVDEFWRAAGRFLAKATGAEDACPATGAAAGMAIAVAAVIAGTDTTRIERLPDAGGLPNEVILQKGHSISYGGAPIGQMIALGGGRAVEVGAVNAIRRAHVAGAINDRTAALVYVTSSVHTAVRGAISLEETVAIGREYAVPVIVDAAAEGDPASWVGSGADLVIFSGPKVMGAPTAGFICGTSSLIEACRAQYLGIARPMKVGKESLMGLLQAVGEYTSGAGLPDPDAQRARMAALAIRVAEIPGLSTEVVGDDAGRAISRVLITIDPDTYGFDAPSLNEVLKGGSPAVYLRDFKMHLGKLEIDPRPLDPAGEDEIVRRLAELCRGSV